MPKSALGSITPIDLDAVVHCVTYVVEREPPSVMLVFLPGLSEILKCVAMVSSASSGGKVQ